MSNFQDPNDPHWRGGSYEPGYRGTDIGWGWLAAAVLAVIVVAAAYGIGHAPTQTASNDVSVPAASQMPPPNTATPRPLNPAAPGLMPPPARPGSATPQ
jgi:hypothetical protein